MSVLQNKDFMQNVISCMNRYKHEIIFGFLPEFCEVPFLRDSLGYHNRLTGIQISLS